MNISEFSLNCFRAFAIVMIIILMVQIARFPSLWWDQLKVAIIVWLLIGIVAVFERTNGFTFELWFMGGGTFILACLSVIFLLSTFMLQFLLNEGPRKHRSSNTDSDIEVVQGEVMPDDADRIWDQGRILAAKAGQIVEKGIVKR